jgi:hypothetical protein
VRNRRQFHGALAALVVSLLVVPGLLARTDAGADPSFAFDAVASADGVRTTVVAPGAPLFDTVADAGGATSAVELDSQATSTAMAAYPNPGDTVLTAPATAAGSGVPLPVPPYPLFASSSYPGTPSQNVAAGPYLVSAKSDPSSSVGHAASGSSDATAAVAYVASDASATVATGSVTATAAGDVRTITIGPVEVASVHSVATTVRSGSAALTRTSDLHVTGLSVAGLPFGVSPQGLTVAGSAVPLPDGSPVAQALSQAHVSVTYLSEQDQQDGIVSAGLEITAAVDQAGHQAQVSYLFGRSAARVAGASGPAPDIGSGPGSGVVGGGSPTSTPAVTSAPPSSVAGAGASTAGAGPMSDIAAGLPAGASSGSHPEPLIAADGAAETVPRRSAVPSAELHGWPRSFFLVLVLGGCLALLTTVLMGSRGERRP